MPRIPFAVLQETVRRILAGRGCPAPRAELAARLIAETSADGVYSHGVNRFPRLVETIDKGYVNLGAEPTCIERFGAFERWDGHQGLGPTNAHAAMARAIELARRHGVGSVALANTNHWLRGGSYGWQAAESGCVGLCWTNTTPNMPAWGGRDPRLGNNPLVIAVPHGAAPVVVDAAMAQFSYGRMETAALRGENLPVPGGYDAEGHLSADPVAVTRSGRVLPIGYWKGSALSLVLDLVAAMLSGGLTTKAIGELGEEYRLSQMFIAFDARRIAGEAMIEQVAAELLAHVAASEAVDPERPVRYPGERVLECRAEHRANGIPVDPTVWERIQKL